MRKLYEPKPGGRIDQAALVRAIQINHQIGRLLTGLADLDPSPRNRQLMVAMRLAVTNQVERLYWLQDPTVSPLSALADNQQLRRLVWLLLENHPTPTQVAYLGTIAEVLDEQSRHLLRIEEIR